MKKSKKKILAFILTVAFIGYGLVGNNSVNMPTAFAHENIEAQNQNIGCEQETQDCEQEHTDDCSSCVTDNHCHSDYLAMPIVKIAFTENDNSLYLKDFNKLNELNYQPGSRPA